MFELFYLLLVTLCVNSIFSYFPESGHYEDRTVSIYYSWRGNYQEIWTMNRILCHGQDSIFRQERTILNISQNPGLETEINYEDWELLGTSGQEASPCPVLSTTRRRRWSMTRRTRDCDECCQHRQRPGEGCNTHQYISLSVIREYLQGESIKPYNQYLQYCTRHK